MSKLSIYENEWINLVFEGRNKEYGAYQLRQESGRTTMAAFFMGLFLIGSLASLTAVISHFTAKEKVVITVEDFTNTLVELSNIKLNDPKPVQLVLPIAKKEETEVIRKEQLTDPVIVSPNEADEIATNKENKPTSPVVSEGTGAVAVPGTPTLATGTATGSAVDTGTAVNTTIALDKLPEFPGGIEKFYVFVGKNFERPEIEDVKMLRVYVSFVIEKDGSMTDIQVRKDPGYGLAKEAIRVLKSLKTKWSPGMIGGKPVRTAYNLPITVQMQ